jgi:toxin ParE1/3/4
VKLELILAPEAEAEIAEARDWYDARRLGLGAEFLAEVHVALAVIEENPLQYQISWQHFRSVGLDRFPYNLIYSVSSGAIRVVACVHGKRDPKVWRERTP